MTQDKLTQLLAKIKEPLNHESQSYEASYSISYDSITFLLALVEEYQKALESIALDQYDSSDMRQFHSRAKSALARGEELAGGE